MDDNTVKLADRVFANVNIPNDEKGELLIGNVKNTASFNASDLLYLMETEVEERTAETLKRKKEEFEMQQFRQAALHRAQPPSLVVSTKQTHHEVHNNKVAKVVTTIAITKKRKIESVHKSKINEYSKVVNDVSRNSISKESLKPPTQLPATTIASVVKATSLVDYASSEED